MDAVGAHWADVWANKDPAETSWYQEVPEPCSTLVRGVSTPASRVILVGGGASSLVTDLLERGYTHLEVIDISDDALGQLRARLGSVADRVHLRQADVRDLSVDESVDVWHDRATFHFLTEPADRAAYVRNARTAVRPGGHLVIGTFALDGPDQCSGLPVARYDAESLAAEFADGFERVDAVDHDHETPWETRQHFVHVVLRRRREGLNN